MLRMRIWRALKAAGAGPLRDGAYLLPNRELSRQVLEELGEFRELRPEDEVAAIVALGEFSG